MADTYLKGIKYGFNAHGGTEGFYGVGMNREDMKDEILTFMPITIFFEFIKEEEMHDENPKTYLLSEVRIFLHSKEKKVLQSTFFGASDCHK